MRLPVAVLLAVSTLTASAATFESRSQNYALAVDVQTRDGAAPVYTVRLTDLRTNTVMLTRQLDYLPGEATLDEGDVHVNVHVRTSPSGISATAEIEQGDMLVDSIHAVWMLRPRRARIRAPGALRVGGDVRAPIVLRRVEPMYTEEARRERIAGIVIVEVHIDKTGVVKDAVVLKELPGGLSASALEAVKQWTFQPALKNGEPVDVVFNLTINFKLGGVEPQ